MTSDERFFVIDMAFRLAKEHPEDVGKIIDAASAGIKAYADSQGDSSGALSARLITVLENNKVSDFGTFSAKEVLSALEPSYGGTVGLKNLKKKYGVNS